MNQYERDIQGNYTNDSSENPESNTANINNNDSPENTDECFDSTSIPNEFGNYKKLHKIGDGSSCIVIMVQHKKTGNIYACKCVSRKLLVEAGLFLRFEQEVRILQSLHNPNILEVQDIVYEENYIYLILEYCTHGELFNYIIEKGRLLEDEARMLFAQLVNAIHFIHIRGIAHRDLKPENILLNENMNIKLADFGLCHASAAKILLKTPCGSPFYAPPEVISGEQYDGFKGDVWSLGVVLYTMTTGALPWTNLQAPGLYRQISTGSYSIPEYISPELKDLIKSMMTVDPVKRIDVEHILSHPWMPHPENKIQIGHPNYTNIYASSKSYNPNICQQKIFKQTIQNDAFQSLKNNVGNNKDCDQRMALNSQEGKLLSRSSDDALSEIFNSSKTSTNPVPNGASKNNYRRPIIIRPTKYPSNRPSHPHGMSKFPTLASEELKQLIRKVPMTNHPKQNF